MVTYKIQLPTKRQKRAERKENVQWTFLAKEPAGAKEKTQHLKPNTHKPNPCEGWQQATIVARTA